MILDDFDRVAAAAVKQIDALLAAWLPNGVRDGAEFCIGSRHGEAGKSMRIRLNGDKAGYWSDFSDEGAAGRDLISLYAYLEGITQGKACAAVAEQCGVELTEDPDFKGKKNKGQGTPAVKPRQALAPAGVGDKAPPKPRTEWMPILPVPVDAPPAPKAHTVRGRPEKFWEYHDQDWNLLGVIYRFLTSDGGKEVLPCVFAEHSETKKREWRWISFREPRPLYLTAPLREGFPVLIVEGEKCADAAFQLVGDVFDVVSWPGGGKAVEKVDWTPLAGRRVVIWPDCDAKTYKQGHAQAGQIKPEAEQPGMLCAVKISKILAELQCAISFVDIPDPGQVDDGWDVADLIDAGATRETVLMWTERLRAVEVPQPAQPEVAASADAPPAADDDADLPSWVTDGPTEGESIPCPAGAGAMSKKDIYWKLIRTEKGGVKGCRENVYLVLMHDPRLMGLVALDQFSQLQVKRRMPPWKSEPGEWTEGDDFHLGNWLAHEYELVIGSIGEIEKSVAQAARENAFNPVIDYMDKCRAEWDGESRIERAFSAYWGAINSPYMRLISQLFFVGLVKRAYVPGVKHDCAPVFEGGQGFGKSTALRVLGGEWFADTPFKMGDKDGYLSIQGVLLYEVAELEQFNRSETTAIKAFMSSLVDRYREPYGRRMKNMPRRTVFAATTNEGEYFKDTTGNRRFWPVEIGRMDIEGLKRDRDQLFGEAVALMEGGARWYPTREEQDTLISPEQEKREIADPWLGRIYEYVEGRNSDGEDLPRGKVNRVTARELLTKALFIDIGKLGPAKMETMRIAACMRKLGWEKGRETQGARERFYERPKDPPAAPSIEADVPEMPAPEYDERELDDLPI